MFKRILHANDGSGQAFHALQLAVKIARENDADLHMISVEEIDHMLEFAGELRGDAVTAARQFHKCVQRAQALAEEQHVQLKTHVMAGHAVRDILTLSEHLEVDLLVIGATGHSAFYERMLGTTAARVVHLAKCPVLVVK